MRQNFLTDFMEQCKAQENPVTQAEAAEQLARKPLCSECSEPLYTVCELEDKTKEDENRFYVGIRDCSCEKKAQAETERRRIEEIAKKKADYIAGSGLPPRFCSLRFEGLQRGHNQSFDTAFEYCNAYCKNVRRALNEGLGVYLYGPAGVGKTTLTACMIADFANQVIDSDCASRSSESYASPLHLIASITTMADIARKVKATYRRSDESEDDILRRIYNVPVLFLDDFGTERMNTGADISFVQELTYQVINKRYGENRPTIITSNYSLAQLRMEVGVMDKTVDRINEMCDRILQISGESFRKTLAATRAKLF